MNQEITNRMIRGILKLMLESWRAQNVQAELLSKRIDKLDSLVRLLANGALNSGAVDESICRDVIERTKPGVGELFRQSISKEIGTLDGFESMIVEFEQLVGLDPDPADPG